MQPVYLEKKGNTKIVSHRGLSGVELENTLAAFVAAGNRCCFGIETDVHVTADGKYVILHDDSTGRVGERDLPAENSTFAQLRGSPARTGYGRVFGYAEAALSAGVSARRAPL